MEDYDIITRLGGGTFADVYQALEKSTITSIPQEQLNKVKQSLAEVLKNSNLNIETSQPVLVSLDNKKSQSNQNSTNKSIQTLTKTTNSDFPQITPGIKDNNRSST